MARKNQRSRGASACGSAQSVKLSKNLTILEKKTYGYQERDEEKRQEFRLKISQTKPENRVYLDESGIDNREDYGYGWNLKGKRFHDLKSGKRRIRVSSILDFRFRLRPCCRSGILDCPLLSRRGLQILDKRFWIND